ncbi:MAG: diacylglycerol kinase family protein [Acidimicrobiia bacterium]|nr:diacylglycerol kinase family protein [Acidimicrobiia bacterium]
MWWVLVNPSAGVRGEIEGRARAAVNAAGVEYTAIVSASPEDLADRVTQGIEAGATNFAAVGGDGTAHLVLNALMRHAWGSPPTLAILPAGSGSDFIRTFALPKTMPEMASRLATDDRYRCDVGIIEGSFGRRFFLNAANVGVAAASVEVADRLPRRLGGARYAAGFWLKLARFGSVDIHLRAGSRTFAGKAISVVIANGQFFGGGMNVAPRAALMDGKLDIQVFVGPRRRAFSVMPRVVRGTHLGMPGVRRFEAGEFHIDVPDDWPVEADGEVLGTGSVRGSVVPGAIDFKL